MVKVLKMSKTNKLGEDKVQAAMRLALDIIDIMDEYDEYTGRPPMSDKTKARMMIDAAVAKPIFFRLKNILHSMTYDEYKAFHNWLDENPDLDPEGWGVEFNWGTFRNRAFEIALAVEQRVRAEYENKNVE